MNLLTLSLSLSLSLSLLLQLRLLETLALMREFHAPFPKVLILAL